MTPEISIRATSGDIEDEFDRPPEMVVRLAENRWRVGGGVSVRSLKKIFQGIPETSGTINDLVKSYLEGKELKKKLSNPILRNNNKG